MREGSVCLAWGRLKVMERRMNCWSVVVAGLSLSLILGGEVGLAQAPPASAPTTVQVAPRATAAAGGHNGGVGAEVPPETPAKELTPKQNELRMAGWRAEIRKTLYVPDKLPALEPRTWSTFSPTPGVLADRVTYHTMDGM